VRALILTCNTGGGHNACAKALQQSFQNHGTECDIADAIAFASLRLSRFMSWGHSTMYRRIPKLFKLGYTFSEKHPALLNSERFFRRTRKDSAQRLYAYITENNYDTVLCTHVFSSLLVSQMLKACPMIIKTAFIATDYTCSPGTAASGIDLYFIPHESIVDEYVSCGIEKRKIIPSGIPINNRFYTHNNKSKAKQALGLDVNSGHILMMCGSMGCGPILELTKAFMKKSDDSFEISIICGTNSKLKAELDMLCKNSSHIHVRGYVDDMAELMDSADIFLTKAGGLSTTEAAAKALPMVFVNAVAGCETHNMNFFLERKCAATANDTDALVDVCMSLLKSPAKLEKMSDELACLCSTDAAELVYSCMNAFNVK